MGLVTLGMVGQLLSQRSDLLMSRCKKSCDFQSHYQTDRLNIFFKCFFLQVICPTANKMPVTLNSGKNSLPEHLVAIDMKDNHLLRSPAVVLMTHTDVSTAGFEMPSWFDLMTLDATGPEDEPGIKAASTLVNQLSFHFDLREY